jgi:hypothetical protein
MGRVCQETFSADGQGYASSGRGTEPINSDWCVEPGTNPARPFQSTAKTVSPNSEVKSIKGVKGIRRQVQCARKHQVSMAAAGYQVRRSGQRSVPAQSGITRLTPAILSSRYSRRVQSGADGFCLRQKNCQCWPTEPITV